MQEESFYRPIIIKAWQTAWNHKRLWILGLLAGILNSGAVFLILFRVLRESGASGFWTNVLHGTLPGATTLGHYLQKLSGVSDLRIMVTVTALLLLTIAFLTVAGSAQGALLQHIDRRHRLRKGTPPTFWQPWPTITRIVGVNLATKVVGSLLLFATSVLLWWTTSPSFWTEVIFNTLILGLLTASSLLLSYTSIFTLIEIAVQKKSFGRALLDAWIVLRDHWLLVTEVALGLFFLNLLATMGLVVAMLLFTIPYLIVFTGAMLSGSFIIWAGSVFIGTFMFFALVLTWGGWLTTFTYATWYEVYWAIGKTSIISKIERIIKRIMDKR